MNFLLVTKIFYTAIVFLFGVLIGSFLNVLIYRIPKGENFVTENSHCMTCNHRLYAKDLVPLFSWLFLGGKCRYCKAKISAQYPIVEATNGIMYALIFWFICEEPKIALFGYCAAFSALLVATVIDWRTMEIPDSMWVTVLIGGINIANLPSDKVPNLRRCMGIVFQDYKLLQNQTVYDNISYVIRTLGISSSDIRTRVMGALKVVGLLDKAHAKPSELSGGEQQRVSIARALVNGPPLLIADEPTGNLDPKNSLEVMQILEQINQRGITVIVSTHDYTLVDRFRKRVLTLENGEIIRDIQAGTYGQ